MAQVSRTGLLGVLSPGAANREVSVIPLPENPPSI